MALPLKGVVVVDFSQFLAGPYASLRLQDLGARVIKVENPSGGDLCRRLYLSDTMIEGDSTLFHAINRGKESITLDLKTEAGRAQALRLAAQAHVVIQNFRPGVIDRLGLSFQNVRAINPKVVYGSVSGYGTEGPWKDLPGQDLLAQARSGIMWLNGNRDSGPVPVGVPLADLLTGATLAQGLLAGLYRQAMHNEGTLVETSLLECMADVQFELLTTYLNNGQKLPEREAEGSAHGYLSAPYGVYETDKGQLALAMMPLTLLAAGLDMPELIPFEDEPGATFTRRAEVRALVSKRLLTRCAADWERDLSAKGIWCARVLKWPELLESKAFKALDMLSKVGAIGGVETTLMRSPLRLDGQRTPISALGPALNADVDAITQAFLS
ncbi:CaiB/BaiF CoA transferase family protein [Cognatishimia maritima]|uniref:Crotonobetainyl-CoA:carnitine CoA-transferase CaiB n=1 Tax=Cognatishimia maritima TaxID=870908 RepID=A0A1M5QJE2_9RHOB|nr:CaiB/BaiF CoA-transferase family protein [Cognatishimia maritima]SHH14098.1 Crotonobetainyl-CoA:carnitine CoA-transferase CaiB [Cognatishimia maritima]